MKPGKSYRLPRAAGVAALAIALAACAAKQPVAYVPPPQVVIPPQPRPPLGAPANLVVPPLDSLGVRHTINFGITPAQTVWNLRSAYNVAALNCQRPEHAAILEGYKTFLKANAKRLTAINREVDKDFNTAKGKSFVRAREAYMTQVYNYYALPPTLPAFCDAALAMSQDAATVPAKELDSFAMLTMPKLERVFLDFYNSYEQYRADLAAWQSHYAPAPEVTVAAGPAAVPTPGN